MHCPLRGKCHSQRESRRGRQKGSRNKTMLKFKTKAEARAFFKEKRAALDPEDKKNMDAAIRRHLHALPEFREADPVLFYYPIKGEIDLRPLMEQGMKEGKRVALPVCREGEMHFRLIGEGVEPGAFGIPEPKGERVAPTERTLCILPGYGYNGGHRLGYGGGYYDRFLRDFPGKTVFACYDGFFAEFPTEEHDIPAQIILTEKGII